MTLAAEETDEDVIAEIGDDIDALRSMCLQLSKELSFALALLEALGYPSDLILLSAERGDVQ